MRLIFIGSGEFGLPTLQHLAQQHEVVAVISQPDRRAGRGRHMQPTAIATWAADHGLAVYKTDNINDEQLVQKVREFHSEASIVVAFGQKLGEAVIEALGGLVVNLHASLLPKYRGAMPINWAIIQGETQTGLSVISLSQRMDGGQIYATTRTPIDPMETAGELHDRLTELGPSVIDKVLHDYAAGSLSGQVQDDAQMTRAPKMTKADGTVDFDQPAEQVRCRIHGLTPWPGVRVTWEHQKDGHEEPLILRRVMVAGETDRDHQSEIINQQSVSPGTILQNNCVAVRGGAVQLLELQLPGKRPMTIKEFSAGHPLQPGDRLLS